MKKNRMMRLASVLLVLTLLTTSVISGTFAKYTTQDSASDTARVAKWGVELQVVGNLYGDSYGAEDKIVLDDDTGVTVQSVNRSDDIVAPGTKNDEGFTFSLKGQPEVDGEVTTEMVIQNVFLKAGTYGVMIPVDADVVTAANFDEFENLYVLNDGAYSVAESYISDATYYTLEDSVTFEANYYPVVYKLTGGTEKSSTYSEDSLKAAADAIADQLGLTAGVAADDTSITYTGTKSFQSNDKLDGWKIVGEKLTWEWKFDQDDAAKNGDETLWTNGADTILGMLKNTTNGVVVKMNDDSEYVAVEEYTDYCLDTQFSINITVTQVN